MRVLITGASRGVGRSIAVALSKTFKHECQLALLARSEQKNIHDGVDGTLLETVQACEEHGSHAIPFGVDLKDTRAHQQVLKRVLNAFDGLDGLVNNASVLSLQPTEKAMMLTTSVNYHATLLGIQTCLPALERSKGSIVTLSPPIRLGRLEWISRHPSYTISKYAMTLSTLQAASDKVRANCIWPKRLVRTAATQRLETEFGVEGAYTNGRDPDEFAQAVVHLLTSKQHNASTLFDEDILDMSPSNAPLDAFVEEHPGNLSPLL